MAILTRSGRAALAAAVMAQPIHLALGTGDPAWDTGGRPAEDPTATTLLGEVGRRPVDEVYFVAPDPAGGIVVPTGRYAITSAATNHLFIRVRLDFTDATDATLREQGLFVGTVTNPALPPGQMFFTPGDLNSPGILLLLQHSVPIVRELSSRDTFEFVVTF